MTDCTHCKWAEWDRTESGRLHPSGDGRCRYPWRMPQLPASMYWIGSRHYPTPSGGYISRKDHLSKDCAYYKEEGK